MVDSSYTKGALTAIPNYAPSLSYHANGTLSSVTHANGVVWSQTAVTDRLGRAVHPLKIDFLEIVTCVLIAEPWST